VRVGIAVVERAAGAFQRLVQPGGEVATVRERSAFDDTQLVDPVEKERGARLRPLGLVDDSDRSRSADHQCSAFSRHAAGPKVRARSVEQRRVPTVYRDVGDLGKTFCVEAQRVEQLLVPRARVEVDETGRRRHRDARGHRAPEELRVQVVAERDEAVGGSEHGRLFLREPGELRRPVARVDHTTRSRMHGLVVDTTKQPVGRVGGTRIAPGENRRQRPPMAVERQEAVAEARCADRVDLAGASRLSDRLARVLDDQVRVVLARIVAAGRLLSFLGRFVEHVGTDRRGADIESEYLSAGHRADDNAANCTRLPLRDPSLLSRGRPRSRHAD